MAEIQNTAVVYVCRKCGSVYYVQQAQKEFKDRKKTFIIRTTDFSVVVEINLGICSECQRR